MTELLLEYCQYYLRNRRFLHLDVINPSIGLLVGSLVSLKVDLPVSNTGFIGSIVSGTWERTNHNTKSVSSGVDGNLLLWQLSTRLSSQSHSWSSYLDIKVDFHPED